jgi:hypothetical protein
MRGNQVAYAPQSRSPGRVFMRNYGTRTFENIDKSRVDSILKVMADHGSLVTGTNPWDVDTRTHGVRLLGVWNEEASKLSITVTDAAWYAPPEKIWEHIESLMRIAQDAA